MALMAVIMKHVKLSFLHNLTIYLYLCVGFVIATDSLLSPKGVNYEGLSS